MPATIRRSTKMLTLAIAPRRGTVTAPARPRESPLATSPGTAGSRFRPGSAQSGSRPLLAALATERSLPT